MPWRSRTMGRASGCALGITAALWVVGAGGGCGDGAYVWFAGVEEVALTDDDPGPLDSTTEPDQPGDQQGGPSSPPGGTTVFPEPPNIDSPNGDPDAGTADADDAGSTDGTNASEDTQETAEHEQGRIRLYWDQHATKQHGDMLERYITHPDLEG